MKVWAEKQRRTRGDKLFKGVEKPCRRCGATIITRGIDHRYCDACRPLVRLENNRRAEAKRERPGRIKVGTLMPCCHCGVEFTKVGVRQRYCSPECKYAFWCGKPSWIIGRRMNASINASLRREGRVRKSRRPWESLVGYTLADLMRHLERQFAGRMSWANRAEWHIDHIRPLASFDYASADDPEFRAAWSLANLRPLWSAENLSKSDKRTVLV